MRENYAGNCDSRIIKPQHVRESLGIVADTEVDFVEENGRFYLAKMTTPPREISKFRHFQGSATMKMRTDDIVQLTRAES